MIDPSTGFDLASVAAGLGGGKEGTGLFRSRNAVEDVSSNFNTGIPLPQSPQYHEGEFRGSARQSRFALLVHGDVSLSQRVGAFAEFDLQGAASTANGVQSNSYNPRVRQAYGAYNNANLGLHILAGQAWSLVTMNKVGVTPRQENIPLTIDQQYVPGSTWVRQPQFRIAKEFGDGKCWLAASLECPQVSYSVGANGTGVGLGAVNYTNPGSATLASGQPYSTDVAPDVIAKFAADPGWSHYEVYGMARFFRDRVAVTGNGHNTTRLAGGWAAA